MKQISSLVKQAAARGSRLALTVLFGASWSIPAFAKLPGEADVPAQEEAPGHIIVFKKNVNAQVAANELKSQNGLKVGRVYNHAIKGVFIPTDLPPQALEALQRNPNVDYVEKNGVCKGSSQALPTGIDRSDVEYAVSIDGIDDLVDVDIAIVDSGINLTHPDLNVNSSMSVAYFYTYEGKGKKRTRVFNESFDPSDWTDAHGHGTHVAGIAGARDNSLGVVGVAPGARLTSVRVLDENNSTTYEPYLAGLDYVAANADTFEVVNISIQGTRSTAINDAIVSMTEAGIVVVVCAGNFSADADNYSPASAPSAITVSALADSDGLPGGLGPDTSERDGNTLGADDTLAVFSNFGPVIDVAAPGVDIYSTDLNGGYSLKSGTSMASPHVAGAVALHISIHGRDRDGNSVIDANDVALMELLVTSTGWQSGAAEYFSGDTDGDNEPLLNAANLIDQDIDRIPSISITSPSDGDVVVGPVLVQADASDDHDVTQVEFFVDGTSIGIDSDSSDGYSLNWNSILGSDGSHEISAIATDDALQTATTSIIVSADNIDSAPVADAGLSQTVKDGELVTLDGSGSSDDRAISSYVWSAGSSPFSNEVSPSVILPVGNHLLTLTVFDSILQSSQDSVEITVEPAPPAGAIASVGGILLNAYGGKNRNNHLEAIASIENDLGTAIAGAVVEADLYHDDSKIGASTSTTDSSGSAFLFNLKGIAPGCYDVVITNVTVAEVTFDGVTPENKFCK